MKQANRFVCALLSCLMLLAACAPAASNDDEKDTGKDTAKDTKDTAVSDTADSTDDTSAEEETTSDLYTDNLPDANFDGQTLAIFGDSRSSVLIVDQEALNVEPTGILNEKVSAALYKSRTEIEERFNCKIRYDEYEEGDVDGMFRNLVQTGDSTYQLCMARDGTMTSLAMSGYTYNLANISQFDFSQPWYARTTETMAFGDMRFLGSSFLACQLLQSCRVIVFNRSMWEDLQMELPYDKVFAGEWYLDDFATAVQTGRRDVNGDNEYDLDNDIFGFATQTTELYCFQKCLNIKFVDKDENNMPQFTTDCLEKATQYYEKMHALYDQSYAAPSSLGTGFGQQHVASGHALMCYTTMGRAIRDIVPSDIEFGYLPAPKLDENQEDYIFCTTDTFWAIPTSSIKSDTDKDFIGTVVEAYQCSNYNYARPAYFETAMKYQAANHEEDSRILNMIPERLVLDLGYSYSLDSNTVNIVNSVKPGKLASTVEKAAKALPKKIDNIIDKLSKAAATQAGADA